MEKILAKQAQEQVAWHCNCSFKAAFLGCSYLLGKRMDELIKLGTYRRNSRKETFLSQLQKQEHYGQGTRFWFVNVSCTVQYTGSFSTNFYGYFVCLL